ncbi:GntR family transcriptional regulator [Streptomyces sp. NPDC090022]|uniref:GntR family transcriptional regulator n=1 Tax=Streptomyces sp. NPDC090022 TaxID=3365920 RepID=UPI0037F5588E
MTLLSDEDESFDPRPLHARIAADLRGEIMNGDLAPGAKVPSTAQLKSRFDASNATIQKALQLLKDEGLVIGRAGAAVTVRQNRQQTVRPATSLTPATAGETYPWLAEAAARGSEARSDLIEVREAPVQGDIAAALALAPGTPVVVRRQLITIDGEPAELVSSYYPLDVAQGTALAEARRIRGGTPTLLAALGFPPRLSVDRISARIPTRLEHAALRLPGDLPVLRTLRAVYSDDHRPIEATEMVKAGHLYELQYEFTPE